MYDRIILKGVRVILHYIYLYLVASFDFFCKNWIIIFLILFAILLILLPIIILLKVLKSDEIKCKMKQEEHKKEMELKQAQIDYYNSHGKDA